MLFPEGQFGRHTRPAREVVRPDPARVGAAESLTALAAEWVFFTPALLYAVARLDRDPVGEWVADAGGRVAVLTLPDPVFAGLGVGSDSGWNHRLLLCERGRWEDLRRALANVVVVDRPRRRVYRTFTSPVMVPDGLASSRKPLGIHPPVAATAVGLAWGDRRVRLRERAGGLPAPFAGPPDPADQTLARAVLAGDVAGAQAALSPLTPPVPRAR